MNNTETLTPETKQYKLKIVHDDSPENPFEEWDCEPSLMVEAGRNYSHDYSKGEIDNYLSCYLSDNQIIRYQKIILDLLDMSADDLKGYSKQEKINELSEGVTNFIGESFDNKEKFCVEFGIKHYRGTSTGYSQGDWADVFIIVTDKDRERLGILKKNDEIACKGAFDLYTQWAWGDVYGFQVIKLTTCDLGHEHEDVIDSCYGFYGRDFLENGMMEHIDAELFGGKEKLIEIIKNIEVEY